MNSHVGAWEPGESWGVFFAYYASIHRYLKLNILDKNWGDGEIAFAGDIGYE